MEFKFWDRKWTKCVILESANLCRRSGKAPAMLEHRPRTQCPWSTAHSAPPTAAPSRALSAVSGAESFATCLACRNRVKSGSASDLGGWRHTIWWWDDFGRTGRMWSTHSPVQDWHMIPLSLVSPTDLPRVLHEDGLGSSRRLAVAGPPSPPSPSSHLSHSEGSRLLTPHPLPQRCSTPGVSAPLTPIWHLCPRDPDGCKKDINQIMYFSRTESSDFIISSWILYDVSNNIKLFTLQTLISYVVSFAFSNFFLFQALA